MISPHHLRQKSYLVKKDGISGPSAWNFMTKSKKDIMQHSKENKTDSTPDNIEEHLAELVYPPGEDILSPGNSSGRVDVDVDNITRGGDATATTKTPGV